MCHTYVFVLGILNYAYWVLKDAFLTLGQITTHVFPN